MTYSIHYTLADCRDIHLREQSQPDVKLTGLIETIGRELRFSVEVDVDKLLEQHGQIAVTWSIEDVHEVRPDLNDEQAMEVLKAARDGLDAEYGISWDVLRLVAEAHFGELGSAEAEASSTAIADDKDNSIVSTY